MKVKVKWRRAQVIGTVNRLADGIWWKEGRNLPSVTMWRPIMKPPHISLSRSALLLLFHSSFASSLHSSLEPVGHWPMVSLSRNLFFSLSLLPFLLSIIVLSLWPKNWQFTVSLFFDQYPHYPPPWYSFNTVHYMIRNNNSSNILLF